MALQTTSGACGALDPLFLPIENAFAAKPATRVCCCGEDLRLGLMIITAVLGAIFLADGMSGLLIGVRNPLWPISATELAVAAVSAFGFHGLYNRRPEGARLLARLNLVLTFGIALLLVTLPLWVPLLCQGVEELALDSDRDHCAAATTDTACGTVAPAQEATGGGAGGLTAACVWNATSTPACVMNPALKAARDADRDGPCLIRLEVLELVSCVAFIAFEFYLVWVFIGYAAQFEAGEGAQMCGLDVVAREHP
eukprot:SAG31_NODE_1732_length_7421_cov_10.241191_7_plen_254_part_00